MSNHTPIKGISRIDTKSTHGWFVRGYRNGKTYTKLFSDRKNGGKEVALEAARTYRQQLLEELSKIPQKERERRVVSKDSRNRTGELGSLVPQKRPERGDLRMLLC